MVLCLTASLMSYNYALSKGEWFYVLQHHRRCHTFPDSCQCSSPVSYLPRFSCVCKCRGSTLLFTQQLSWESGRIPSCPPQLLQSRLVFPSQIHLSSSHLSLAAQPTGQSHLLPWPTVLLASMCPLSSLPTCQSQQWASENAPIIAPLPLRHV